MGISVKGLLVAAASAFAIFPRYRPAAQALRQAYISKALAAAAALRALTEQEDALAYREIAMAWSIARAQAHALAISERDPRADKEIGLVLRSILGAQAGSDWSDRFAAAWKRFEAVGASMDFAPEPDLPPSGEIALAALDLASRQSPLEREEEAIRVRLEHWALGKSSAEPAWEKSARRRL